MDLSIQDVIDRALKDAEFAKNLKDAASKIRPDSHGKPEFDELMKHFVDGPDGLMDLKASAEGGFGPTTTTTATTVSTLECATTTTTTTTSDWDGCKKR